MYLNEQSAISSPISITTTPSININLRIQCKEREAKEEKERKEREEQVERERQEREQQEREGEQLADLQNFAGAYTKYHRFQQDNLLLNADGTFTLMRNNGYLGAAHGNFHKLSEN